MPLSKQIIPIVFSQGVDTKTDKKSVVPGKLIALENGRFVSRNKIQTRNGFEALGSTIIEPQEETGLFFEYSKNSQYIVLF